MRIVFLRLEWMSAHWIHLYLGLVPLGFELVMWERTALKSFICFLLYIKHTMFPSSNSVEEIPTSKTTYCPKWSPQLSPPGNGLTHWALARLPPSTNILNSGDIRISFLFGQPVAKNQIKNVVYLSLVWYAAWNSQWETRHSPCGWQARTQESLQSSPGPLGMGQSCLFPSFSLVM